MAMSTLVRATRSVRSSANTFVLYVATALFTLAVGAELVRLGSFQRQLKATLFGGALIASAAVVVYPWIAFPAILALAPFEFLMKLGGRHAGTNEVLAVGLALVLAPRLRWRELPGWAAWGFACLAVGSFATILGAANQSQALWGAVRWLAVGVVALAAFQMLRTNANASARCADIFSATAILVAVFALLQRAGIFWIVGHPYLAGRVDSSFGYYTVYAGYMMIALLVASGTALDAGRKRQAGRLALHTAAALFAGIGLGVSLSRGAVFGAAVGAVATILLSARRPRRALALVVALVAFAGIAWLAVPSSTRAEFVQRFTQPAASAGGDQEHYLLAHIGERALKGQPLGLGYGNFPAYLQSSGDLAQLHQAFFHSHRLPVQVGLDAGWLGLAGFALLAIMPLFAAMRAARGRVLTPTAAAFAGALVAFLAQGWYDYLFYELSFLVIFSALVWATWHASRCEVE
jgi:O-Antigen ligase